MDIVKKVRLIFLLLFVSSLSVTGADAFNFYGAVISTRELPVTLMRINLYGVRPVIDNIESNSPAAQYGLKAGDVLLSVNDKSIYSASEITNFTTDKLSLVVVRGLKRMDLIFDRMAIENEIAKQTDVQKVAVAPVESKRQSIRQVDNSPPLTFNDNDLDRKYGKATPEQKAAMKAKEQQLKKQEMEEIAAIRQRQLFERQQQIAVQEATAKRREEERKAEAELQTQSKLNAIQRKLHQMDNDNFMRGIQQRESDARRGIYY